jgi:DNA-directed RNA polymerase subunit M/transcription elongation factor TFIIS
MKPFFEKDKQSINMEKAIFNYSIKESKHRKIIKKWDNTCFVNIYMSKLWSIFCNLKNEDIINKIKSGDILVEQLPFMTHQEMNPPQWKELIDRKMKLDESKFNQKLEASTDMFTCRKCKSKKCTYYEMQTRSADEPSTIFVTCLNCGKNWKT